MNPSASSTEHSFSTELTFSTAEPGEHQRWSTWPATQPSERGPEPRPDWLVTSAAAFDTELGILKSGKEADVHLIERAIPDAPPGVGTSVVLAAKRYRGAERLDFHRSSQYEEGRTVRRSRDARAIGRGSRYGRGIAATHWAFAEFNALSELRSAGAAVPYPVQISGTELLLEFIGTGLQAAPRLHTLRVGPRELQGLREQVIDFMHVAAAAGYAHGDLSAYNMLVHDGRVWVIDLPQIVDLAVNPTGLDYLHRDCVNVIEWFARHGVAGDADKLFAELVAAIYE